MDSVIISLIVFFSLLVLLQGLGYGITLGIGEYENDGYAIICASLSGAYLLGAILLAVSKDYGWAIGAMGLSLVFDNLLGLAVEDNVIINESKTEFIAIRYTIIAIKTILLTMMAFMSCENIITDQSDQQWLLE